MGKPFADRKEAGRRLGDRVKHLAGRQHLIVLGLPRGGVPVAAEVARALGAPLDVFMVRKLGVPGHEELAMGAVASGSVRVLNRQVVDGLGISPAALEQVTVRERAELARREALYRGDRPLPDLAGATVVLVDDGVATGSSMLAAIEALRQLHPAAVVAAAPVMSKEAAAALTQAADACVWVFIPETFYGVGTWYDDFTQTADAEVLELLWTAARAADPSLTGGPKVAHAPA